MTLSAECPECAANVSLPDDAVVGEIVQCAECGVELEAESSVDRSRPYKMVTSSPSISRIVGSMWN